MISKIRVINALLIIGLSILSTNASASFFMKCEGFITIKSDLLSIPENNNIKANIQVHNHTFTCTGHSKKIGGKGNRNYPEITLPSTINKSLINKGTHLLVKMKYKTWRGKGGGRSTKWTALKIVETIPPKKAPIKPKKLPVT